MSECIGARGERLLAERHLDDCADDGCPGCLPCPRSHCCICGREHAAGACPGCLSGVDRDLALIEDSVALLLAESLARACADPPGGEALAELAGVSVDAPAAELVGDTALQLLTSWADAWSAVRGDLRADRPTIVRECAYLRRHAPEMACREEPPFADFAEEIGSMRRRVRQMVGDSDMGHTGAPCIDCGGVLERQLTETGFADVWTCRRCRRQLSPAEYWLAVRAARDSLAARALG
ncbi:MAG TPA: hypothetical protein VN088_16185 [Nocardioides sp.]|nr:hypothetical protein [Nocardioides sp.]